MQVPMNITITTAAQRFMRRMVRFAGAGSDAGFRLMVSPGGCSGFQAEFAVDAAPHPGDATLEISGLKIFLPAQSRLILEGVTVDFADTPTQSGLTFLDPKATAAACSTGHAAAPAVATVRIASISRRA